MSLAAILSATAVCSDRPELGRAQLVFAAQTLVEYQARQAMQAGAAQIFIMVEAVTPALSRLVDRLGGDGAQIHLVRDMAGLVRQLPRESDVLLFADGMIVDQSYVLELAREEGNALLVAADEAMTSKLERVDSTHRWAGVARITPKTLFNTLDLIGDWDLVLTLLRAVVQNDPRRVPVAAQDISEGRIALIDNQATADLVGGALAGAVDRSQAGAGAERYLLRPVARFAAARLMRMQIAPANIRWAAAGVSALGLVAVTTGWNIMATVMFLIGLFAGLVARQVAGLGQQGEGSNLLELVPAASAAIGLAWLGRYGGASMAGLHLGLIVMTTELAVRKGKAWMLPPWVPVTPGSGLLILLAGLLAGRLYLAIAVASIAAIAALAAMLLFGPEEDRAGPVERKRQRS
ncbi:MAG: hypothetical protein AB7U35_04530 [Sphingobium sp.]